MAWPGAPPAEMPDRRRDETSALLPSFLPVIQQSTDTLRGMRAHTLFVGIGSPARPVRHQEIAVLDLRQMGEELVITSQPIAVGLHDPQIRHRRAEIRIHHGTDVAV